MRAWICFVHAERDRQSINKGNGVTNLARIAGNEVAVFKADETRIRDAKLDAVIDYAKSVQDWPTLEAAVDQKLEQIREFVRWWDETVGVRHGAGRGNKKNDDPRSFSSSDAESLTGITQQQVSRWRKRLKDEAVYKATLYGAAYRKLMAARGQSDLRGASGTGQNEWYTPPEHIDLARSVLGGIDLDPATSSVANETVRAANIFTADDDGLAKEWGGRVWMNPPYAQPHIAHFVEKLCSEYEAGRVTEAIALTHNYTDTSWFHRAATACSAICFTRGRIGFLSPDGERAAPTQGQAFFYFGNRVCEFAEAFATVGFVVRSVHE